MRVSEIILAIIGVSILAGTIWLGRPYGANDYPDCNTAPLAKIESGASCGPNNYWYNFRMNLLELIAGGNPVMMNFEIRLRPNCNSMIYMHGTYGALISHLTLRGPNVTSACAEIRNRT